MQIKALCNHGKLSTPLSPASIREWGKATQSRHGFTTKTMLIMKMIFLLLTVSFLHASAGTRAQNITVSFNNVPLAEVFKSIEQQTEYTFFYKTAWLNKGRAVTLTAKNTPLKEVLDLCFSKQPFTYSIEGRVITLSPSSVPAIDAVLNTLREISGTVIDSSGNPLSGATVTVKGTQVSVRTDASGRFNINAETGQVLVVSFVGYQNRELRIEAGTGNLGSIQLSVNAIAYEDITVVATGYQQINRNKSTGAVGFVKGDKIKQAGVLGVDQMLAGQLAGVVVSAESGAPGAAAKVRIRGNASINAVQDPLWVVDGLPIEGTNLPNVVDGSNLNELYSSSLAGINVSDIESVTVLKDAAATAIYGARAANGVVVITTKSGKKSERLSVNYFTNITTALRPDYSQLNLLNADQKVNLELDLFDSDYGYFSGQGSVAQILDKYNVSRSDLATLGFNGIVADARNEINALRGINTNWEKELYRNALVQEHNISLSGGNDKATYYFSGGYFNENGTTIGTNAKRYNITLKTDFNLSRKLKFNIGLFANQRENGSFLTETSGFTNPAYYARRASPYNLPRDAAGNYVYDNNILDPSEQTINYNILEERANTSNRLTAKAVNTNFGLSYDILPGLQFRSQLGLQNEVTDVEQIGLANSYYTRRAILASGYFSGGVRQYLIPPGGIISNSNSSLFQYTLKNILEYNFNVGSASQFNILAGNELRRVKTEGTYKRNYGYDPQTLITTPVRYRNQSDIDTYYRDFNSSVTNAFASFFGTASYTLNDKYTLAGSIRFDGSDLFGVDPKYKYLPLWSVSGLWRLGEEDFLKDSRIVDMANLRFSYGLQGNIDKSTSPFIIGQYTSTTFFPGATPERGIAVNTPPNDKLRWEKTINYNAGADFSFFNGVVRATVDWYSRTGKDLIASRALPLETGFQALSVNWGELTNKGVEIGIGTRNISTPSFSWTTDFNIAFNRNKVVREQISANAITPSRQGYPVNAVFGYRYAGINEQGSILVNDKEGKTETFNEFLNLFDEFAGIPGLEGLFISTLNTTEQRQALYQYLGSADPLYAGGLTNTFRYKAFELGIGLAFNMGQKVLIAPPYSITAFNRGLNTNTDILNRWTPENTSSNLPGLIYNDGDSYTGEQKALYSWLESTPGDYNSLDRWLRNAGYVRVRSIRLAYGLPNNMLSKAGIKEARLSLEARNPFVFAKDYSGFFDPENMSSNFAQPIQKSITVALNVFF